MIIGCWLNPACGVALASVYDQHPQLQQYKRLVVIICGGIGISFDLLEEYIDHCLPGTLHDGAS